MKTMVFWLAMLSIGGSYGQGNTFPSSGSVGIGTTSPSYKLHVSESVSGLWSGLITHTSNSAAVYFAHSGGYGMSVDPGTNASSSTYAMQVVRGSNSYLYVRGDGNVGIGTASPANTLDIQRDQDAATSLTIKNTLNGSEASAGALLTGQHQFVYTAALSDSFSRAYAGFHPGSGLVWTGATNGLNIISSGGQGSRGVHTGVIRFITYGNDITAVTPGNDAFTRMYIDSFGRVGIGTSAPLEKLSVAGNISANGYITTKKITVTQTGWSDYVFDEAYALPSLCSVEAFVKRYRHLPGVPTAEEVAEKGVSLGDNQALLLKKIEELTLYVIALKRENDNMKVEMKSLRKRALPSK